MFFPDSGNSMGFSSLQGDPLMWTSNLEMGGYGDFNEFFYFFRCLSVKCGFRLQERFYPILKGTIESHKNLSMTRESEENMSTRGKNGMTKQTKFHRLWTT